MSRPFPRRPSRPGSRRGVAIFVVMMVALVLGALTSILWTGGGGGLTGEQAEQSFEKRQAEYLAKGAQQHALLKCRLLPTELYDAVSYSIGRNPYYDFGLGLTQQLQGGRLHPDDANRAPGPMFYTGGSQNQITLKPQGAGEPFKVIVDRTNANIRGAYDDKMDALLSMFIYDISTLFPDPSSPENSVVVVDSSDGGYECEAMGAGWRDPFVGNYKVQALKILGLQGGRRYDRDTMLLTTIGSVKRAGQISLVTNIGGSPKGLSPVRKTIHDSADSTFGEFSTRFESAEDYDARVGAEGAEGTNQVFDDTASGRRTEIATGVYFITRKAFNQ